MNQVARAGIHRKTMGGTTEAALQQIILRAYNRGLREANRLPEK